MLPPLQDLYRIAPEIVLCAFGMLVMFLAPIIPKARHGVLSAISLLGAAFALAATQFLAMYPGPAYSGLLRSDAFSLFVHLIVCGVGLPRDSGLGQLSQTRRSRRRGILRVNSAGHGRHGRDG